MGDLIRESYIKDGKIIDVTKQDHTDTYEDNQYAKINQKEHFKYLNGKQLFHAAKIDMAFIDRMANGQCCPDGTTYKFITPDKDERKRALLHVQSSHKEWMRVNDNPFAKNKSTWI